MDLAWTDLRPLSLRSAPADSAAIRPQTTEVPLHRLVSAQAVRTPDTPAVSAAGRRLTYAELDERSDDLARRLGALGVGPETVVGLCVGRTPALVVAMLAILKAGGAYLPLETTHPPRRLASLLAGSGARALVTDGTAPIPPGWGKAPVAVLDPDGRTDLSLGPQAPSLPTVTAAHLAYVIHTSGSSGAPKAVHVTHGSLVNLLVSVVERIPLTASDVMLAVTTVCFDIAGLELLAPLLAGGHITIAARAETVDGTALARRLAQDQVTVMQATPATWQLLLDSGWQPTAGLTMLCGGEALPADLAHRLLAGGGRLWNLYGPTETTIWSSAGRVISPVGDICLGEPLANTRIHVLDAHLDPVSPGGVGQIAITGRGLARGYGGQPGRTAERFVADPYATRPGERLYLTGDLARRLPDGSLLFLGRSDDQVKVRGHRIEPAEVEEHIVGHPLVRQAVVAAAGTSAAGRQLVAAVTAVAPGIDSGTLIRNVRHGLADTVPPYMIPDRIIVLPDMPLAETGKVDRRAVAALVTDAGAPGPRTFLTRASTALERELAEVFSTILGLPEVGVHDDFFELGGHSLLAARLVLQVQRRFAVRLPLAEFVQRATVASLAAAIAKPQQVPLAGTASGLGPGPSTVEGPAADVHLDESITAVGKATAWPRQPRRILLTGSTGYLGAHLLGELLRQTDAEIVCLARADSRTAVEERQARALRRYGLTGNSLRTTVLPGDLSRPCLGLSAADFAELAHTVEVIYHCGSEVNLVLPYGSLRSANVGGTREVIRLACTTRAKPVHYVSTVGILRGTDAPSPWTEKAAASRPPGTPDGYVQSKWAAERLLALAADRGLVVSVHRPFLVMSHTATGACTADNFLSIMLRTFLDLGVFPDCDALLDIVPVDFVSQAMVRMCQSVSCAGGTYHFASPRPASFRDVHGWLRSYGYHVEPVSYPELRDRLAGLGPDHPVYPVLPLLEAKDADAEYAAIFNQSFSCTQTWRALRESGIICEPVGEPLVHRALSYLVRTGFLEPPRRQRERLRSF